MSSGFEGTAEFFEVCLLPCLLKWVVIPTGLTFLSLHWKEKLNVYLNTGTSVLFVIILNTCPFSYCYSILFHTLSLCVSRVAVLLVFMYSCMLYYSQSYPLSFQQKELFTQGNRVLFYSPAFDMSIEIRMNQSIISAFSTF